MSFLVKDDELLEKYSEIRNRLKSELESEPVYNEKYLKAKIKSYDGKIKLSCFSYIILKFSWWLISVVSNFQF